MRLLLPLADRYHDEVAQLVGRALDHPVAITGLGASWHGFGPSIELEGVTVFDDKGQPLLHCAAARVDGALLALGAGGARTWPAVELRSGGADIELWSDWRKGPQRITGTVNASDVQLALQHALREDIQREAPQSADAPAPSTQPPPTSSSTAVVSNQDSLQANPPRQNPASDKSPLATSSEVSPGVGASAAAATSPYARASAAECDAFAADARASGD